MKKLVWVVILSAIFLVGCGTSEGEIQTAVAETGTAKNHMIEITVSPMPSPPVQDLTPTSSITPTVVPKVSCDEDDVNLYLEELDTILEEWDDTEERAGTTSRIALSPVVGELQDLRRETKRLNYPECGEYVNDFVLVAMDRFIDAYIGFMGEEEDESITRQMRISEYAWNISTNAIQDFENNAMGAYEEFNPMTSLFEHKIYEKKDFMLPEGWREFPIINRKLTISVPGTWELNEYDTDIAVMGFISEEDGIGLNFTNLVEGSELNSDSGRFFELRMMSESQDGDDYSELAAYYDVFGNNKGYLVWFSIHENKYREIDERVWALVVTPDNDGYFILAIADNREFTESDFQILETIIASIRYQSEY